MMQYLSNLIFCWVSTSARSSCSLFRARFRLGFGPMGGMLYLFCFQAWFFFRYRASRSVPVLPSGKPDLDSKSTFIVGRSLCRFRGRGTCCWRSLWTSRPLSGYWSVPSVWAGLVLRSAKPVSSSFYASPGSKPSCDYESVTGTTMKTRKRISTSRTHF